MATRKEKRPTHPLDKLFKASIRTISFKKFQEAEAQITPSMPHPWIWPDPQTDAQWTLLGRKAHLLWTAPPDHYVKNHTLAEQAIQLAIKHDQVWHESEPGKPDILMMWLASCRYGAPHQRTQNMLSRALKNSQPGAGVPGDGGYLDQMIAIVEQEVSLGMDAKRLEMIHRYAVSNWLMGTILRTQGTSQADWRPASISPLPLIWPEETIVRLMRLSKLTRGTKESEISLSGGAHLIEQMGDAPSHHIMQALTEDVIDQLEQEKGRLPLGALNAIEHCAAAKLEPDACLIKALSSHAQQLSSMPHLSASVEQYILDNATSTIQTRPSGRARL